MGGDESRKTNGVPVARDGGHAAVAAAASSAKDSLGQLDGAMSKLDLNDTRADLVATLRKNSFDVKKHKPPRPRRKWREALKEYLEPCPAPGFAEWVLWSNKDFVLIFDGFPKARI